MLNNIKNITIFPKLIITFLLVILPMYGVSLYMNESAKESVKKEIVASMASKVHFFSSSFENEVNRVLLLKTQYTIDEDLQDLSILSPTLNNFERNQAILRLQRKLRLMKDSNLYVEEAKLYIPLINKTISTQSVNTGVSEQEMDVLKPPEGGLPAPIVYKEGRYFISGYHPDFIATGKTPIFAQEVQLSEPNIRGFLSSISNYKNGGSILLDNKLEWSIASGGLNKDASLLLTAFTKKLGQSPGQAGQLFVDVHGKRYMASYEKSDAIGTTLIVYVDEKEVLGPINKYSKWFWGLSLLSVIVIVIFSYWIYLLIHQPLQKLVRAFRKIMSGDMDVSVHHKWFDEFYYLFEQFNSMVVKLRELIQTVYEQQIRSQRAELKQLQSQINPHFLYNSFFSISNMAELHDLDTIVHFSKHLGQYFQFITRSGSDEVTIEQEVKHANSYMQIQSIRFARNISTKWGDVPEGCQGIRVPRMILQPLLENAYHHGLRDKLEDGLLAVDFQRRGDALLISVEDNGGILTDEEIGRLNLSLSDKESSIETTALQNVHRRLEIMFGNRYGLTLLQGQWGGLRVEMTIPLHQEDNHA